MLHNHTPTNAPEQGKIYECILNNTSLYKARIENVNGCWATITIVETLPSPHQNHYKIGQQFDIRVSMYKFISV